MPKKIVNLKQDIEPPKKHVPSTTSKNIIVSASPVVQDQDIMTTSQDESLTSLSGNHKLVIKPISNEENLKSNQPINQPNLADSSDNHLLKDIDQLAKNIQPLGQDSSSQQSQPDDAKNKNNPNSQLNQSTNDDQIKDQTTQPSSENSSSNSDKKDQEKNITDLIESKTYFLPITTSQDSRRSIIIFIVITFLMVFIWFEVALYYKLINFFNFKSIF